MARASAPFFSYLPRTRLARHWHTIVSVKEDAQNRFRKFAAGVPRSPTSLLATSSEMSDDRYSNGTCPVCGTLLEVCPVKNAGMDDKVFQYRVLFPHWNSQALWFLRRLAGFSVRDLTEGYLEAKFFATKAEARHVEARIGHSCNLVAVSWWARPCPVCDTDLEEWCGDEGAGRER